MHLCRYTSSSIAKENLDEVYRRNVQYLLSSLTFPEAEQTVVGNEDDRGNSVYLIKGFNVYE